MPRKPLHELTPSQALRERFDLEAEFASAGSPTGMQLDAIQSKILGPGHNGARKDDGEPQQIRYLDLLNLTKAMSAQEVDVARLRWRTLATSVGEDRLRRPSDMQPGDGETVIEHRPVNDKGEPIEGFVRVRGPTTKPASDREVATHLGCSGYQVRMLVGSALNKVKQAQMALKPEDCVDAEE